MCKKYSTFQVSVVVSCEQKGRDTMSSCDTLSCTYYGRVKAAEKGRWGLKRCLHELIRSKSLSSSHTDWAFISQSKAAISEKPRPQPNHPAKQFCLFCLLPFLGAEVHLREPFLHLFLQFLALVGLVSKTCTTFIHGTSQLVIRKGDRWW